MAVVGYISLLVLLPTMTNVGTLPLRFVVRQTLVQTRESREGQENELATLQKKLAELHASR